MKKHLYTIAGTIAVASLVLFACKKKDDGTIHPDYKQNTGTASNPNPNNVTVTGTTTVTDPATQNTSLYVGNAGWSNLSCISTNSLSLKADDGTTQVTLNFAVPPAPNTTQTYNVASTPGVGAVAITINNAPNQPAGIVWYGRSGVISVATTTSAVNAVITGTGVLCVQSTFNFPVVTLTGLLGCN